MWLSQKGTWKRGKRDIIEFNSLINHHNRNKAQPYLVYWYYKKLNMYNIYRLSLNRKHW